MGWALFFPIDNEVDYCVLIGGNPTIIITSDPNRTDVNDGWLPSSIHLSSCLPLHIGSKTIRYWYRECHWYSMVWAWFSISRGSDLSLEQDYSLGTTGQISLIIHGLGLVFRLATIWGVDWPADVVLGSVFDYHWFQLLQVPGEF